MEITEGPECVENIVWWGVTLDQDRMVGWLPEISEDTYSLLPLVGSELLIPSELLASLTPTSPEEVYFADDFDRDTGIWPLARTRDFASTIEAGKLEISVIGPNLIIPMILPDARFKDVELTLEVVAPVSSNGSSFGLFCRRRDNGSGYEFELNDLGRFTVYLILDNTGSILEDLYSIPASSFEFGEINRLEIRCLGDQLEFRVNGALQAVVQDATLEAGQVGFFASSGESGDAKIAFESFRVIEP